MSIKESYASCAGQPSGDTPNGVRPRKAARSRGAHSSEARRKHQKAGEEEDMKAESEDLALQVQAKLTIQLESRTRDLEASMYCTVLLPSENGIVKEVQGLERDNNDMVATEPAVERESRHTWFFNAMLKAIERNLTAKFGELTPLDRMKVEVSQGAPGDYRRWEVHRLQRVDQIVQASPNIRQALTSTQNTHHLATDGYITNKWRKPNADPGHVQRAARCMSVTP